MEVCVLTKLLLISLAIFSNSVLCKSNISDSVSLKSVKHKTQSRQAKTLEYELLPTEKSEGTTPTQKSQKQRIDQNQESDEFDDLPPAPSLSSPNCREPYNGRPYVHFGTPDECYLTGVKGPCPENMILFPQLGSNYGYCDCDCDNHFPALYHSPRSFCMGRTFRGDLRTLAYVAKFKSCQPIFEQGFCAKGYWLVFDDDPKKGPYCERASCRPEDNLDFVFFDNQRGKCARLGENCYAGYRSGNWTYQISDSDWVPICQDSDDIRGKAIPEPHSRYHSGHIQNIRCPPGQIPDRRRGGCKITYDFEEGGGPG